MGKRSIHSVLGIIRSRIIYYGKPFNRRRLKRFYSQFVQPGALCFDIGAHLGNRSDAFLRLGARVVALEPQPACVRDLKQRFKGNEHFTLVEKAVGDAPGQLPFFVSEFTPTISTLSGTEWRNGIQATSSFQVTWDYELQVEVVTLDQLIQIYGMPAFCKIDVEDYEVQALQGLSHAIPALSFEYFSWTPDRTFACFDLLDALGSYEYNWSYGESQHLLASQWLNPADIRAVFEKITPEDRSGDIYARLRKPLPA
jgi:FkbM family methyltransferase